MTEQLHVHFHFCDLACWVSLQTTERVHFHFHFCGLAWLGEPTERVHLHFHFCGLAWLGEPTEAVSAVLVIGVCYFHVATHMSLLWS